MTNSNEVLRQPIHKIPVAKLMLLGGGIALFLILLFLLPIKNPNPDWPKFWMVRPIIVVTLAGAIGGVFYFFMDHLRYQGGWKKIAANVVSLLVYLIGLWLGVVLGLDGTLWN
jgi:hypothetical protein